MTIPRATAADAAEAMRLAAEGQRRRDTAITGEYLDALETVLKHESDPHLRSAARARYLDLTETPR